MYEGSSALSVPESTQHVVVDHPVQSQACPCLGAGCQLCQHVALARDVWQGSSLWPGEAFLESGVQVRASWRKSPVLMCLPLGPSLPRAGALPVGGRTGRVYTLEAASGVEAHLARPTLDAIFLTLVDVWVVGRGRRWEDREGDQGRPCERDQLSEAEPQGETEERPSPTPLQLPGACLWRACLLGISSDHG